MDVDQVFLSCSCSATTFFCGKWKVFSSFPHDSHGGKEVEDRVGKEGSCWRRIDVDDAYMPTILPRRERRSWKKVFGRGRRREGRSRAHATVLQLQLRPPSSVLCQTWRLRGKDDELRASSSSSSLSRRGGRPRPPGRGWQRKGRRRGEDTARSALGRREGRNAQ